MESPQQPTNPVEQGSRFLGRYQILEELGRGAMGTVYKAFDPVIGRTVALKTILIDSNAPDRAQMVDRLKQEAKAAGGLDHPNIITIYDVGDESGAVYLSMQFVKGITLAKLLADNGAPPLPTFISWADQISAAVGFAHARGVIHRDLKPANLMATDQGAIKVLDFGIAKIENTSLTQTGLVIGTPGYMSPEQIAGKKVDHRADIFSMGAVFYELLTCEKPFVGDIATILYKIVNEDPIAPSLINPAIPGWIDAVIRKALAKDPKDRFQSCEEMRKAFLEQSLRAPMTAPATVPAEPIVASRPPARAGVRRPAQLEPARARVWPRLILGSALVFMAAASWAFYIRSVTGAFPPIVAKLEDQVKKVLPSDVQRLSEHQTQLPPHAAEEHSLPAAGAQNEATVAPAAAAQAAATPAASSPTAVSTLQPVAAQTSSDQPASDPTNQRVAISGAPASSPPSETSLKPVDSSQTASTQEVESTGHNQQGTASASAHDSLNSPFARRDDDKQSTWSAVPKPTARKRFQESPVTVDGFSRQDVPDLLRQADSYAARGEYRLARYEYGLVLKLDRNNLQAREGLRHLLAESSR